jgi:hypothetical protein
MHKKYSASLFRFDFKEFESLNYINVYIDQEIMLEISYCFNIKKF